MAIRTNANANANPQIVDDPHMMRYTRTQSTRGAELAKSTPAIVDALINKGYSDSDCRKVLGENMMRVYSTVWGE